MVSLLVDTTSFLDAGAQARSVAHTVERGLSRAVSGLAGSTQMAGSDPNGLKWAASYDQAGRQLVGYAAQFLDAASTLARNLEVTGYYYELTELANAGLTDVALELPPPITKTSRPHLPSAAGGARKFPMANPVDEWIVEQIANLIGDMWPDGDTGKLDHASTVWHHLADDLDDAASSLMKVSHALVGVDTPELPRVHDQIDQIHKFAKKLATACRSVGKACNDLSGQIAHVHLQTEITIGITVAAIVATAAVGLGLTVVTFGVSDVAAAGGVAAEVAGAVGTITGFIAELASTISVGVGLIAESAAGLVGISADLATTIGVTVGDISASAVLWGAAGAGENVISTAITEPDGDLLGAAEDGFVSWGAGGALGGGIVRGAELISGNQIKIVIPGRVDKTMSLRSYQVTYLQSLHNLDADTIMLGKFDSGAPGNYIDKAGDDHEYFSLGGTWDSFKAAHNLTDDDMFKLFNKRFLQEGIDEGKTFHFSHNPKTATGALHDEFIYLQQHGYVFDPDTMQMEPK